MMQFNRLVKEKLRRVAGQIHQTIEDMRPTVKNLDNEDREMLEEELDEFEAIRDELLSIINPLSVHCTNNTSNQTSRRES